MFSLVAIILLPVGAATITETDLDRTTIDALVARLAPDHPRLGFRPRAEEGVRTIEQVRQTYESTEQFRALYKRTLDVPDTRSSCVVLASKWIVTGRDRYAEKAIALLAKAEIKNTEQSGYYSNVWRYALAYDWLYNHPAMTDMVRTQVEQAIVKVLEADLVDLDSGGPSMWHGRNQYANNGLIAVLSLSHHPRRKKLLRAFLGHYILAARALRFVEAWPEGPSYWICNRAIQYPLAADCVRTALGTTRVADVDLVETMRATGYWQLHSMQPNLAFVPYGDAFGGATLNAWQPWTESIDYYARYTGDPGLIAFAAHARHVSAARAYRPDRFGWGLVLSCAPGPPMPKDYDPKRPLEFIQRHVPTARLFGRKSTGFAFVRSSWTDADATHVSFKAGDLFAHHGHYNQGAFTIYKRSALAPITGAYQGYYSAHRLGYYIQTVGVNSLLVLAPGEFSNYLRQHKYPVDALSGGQRVVQATGSYSRSVEHWLNDRSPGRRYEAGNIIAHQSVPGDYDYIAADITAAYNSTRYAEPGNKAKVSHVVRHLVYLHPRSGRRVAPTDSFVGGAQGARPSPTRASQFVRATQTGDVVVIFDRVVTTNKSYRKRWVLHAKSQPKGEPATLIRGNPSNGILVTGGRRFTTTVGDAKLVHQIVLPAQTRVYKIGGPDYAFYAETDGDGSKFTGRNLAIKGGRKPRPSQGLWRVEVEPAEASKEDVFLNVLWPRAADDPDPPPPATAASIGTNIGLVIGDQMLVFCRYRGRSEITFSFRVTPVTRRILIFGAQPGARYWCTAEGERITLTASREGVLAWNPPEGFDRYLTILRAAEHPVR